MLHRSVGGELCRKRGWLARERGRGEAGDLPGGSDSAGGPRRPAGRMGRLHDPRTPITDCTPTGQVQCWPAFCHAVINEP